MTKLLIDEPPVQVLPSLAKAIGLNQAIVLQQIHYWLMNYRANNNKRHYRDGRWWVYNTGAGWVEQFPWWSETTVRRILSSLRKAGLIEATSKYNEAGYDRTLWYTINYEAVRQLSNDRIQSNRPNPFDQIDKMDLVNLTTPIPETNTETNTDIASVLFEGDCASEGCQPPLATESSASEPVADPSPRSLTAAPADARHTGDSSDHEPVLQEKNESSNPEAGTGKSSRTRKQRSEKRAPTPPAVKRFRAEAHRYPPKSWYADIAETVGDDPVNLARWGRVVHEWVGRGWNPTNISGMLEMYRKGISPTQVRPGRDNTKRLGPVFTLAGGGQ